MVEFIFCMTSILFMAWVVVLKLREDTLKKEIERLSQELDRVIKKKTGDVAVSGQSHVWGHKPFWMK